MMRAFHSALELVLQMEEMTEVMRAIHLVMELVLQKAEE